jgi:deoxycytidine triphosphate deaminase
MLSKAFIEELIRKKELEISYTFIEQEGGIVKLPHEQFVNPDAPELSATKMFNKNFTGADRFYITMGSIAMSHSIKRHDDRVNFHNKDYFFDLLATNNEFEILPGETISICSNERIGVNGKYGAYMLPRLTNADAGLFYIPSYIDPYWNGVMQDVLYNFSQEKIKIKIGEGLAIVRFYEIKGEIDNVFKKNFPIKSHHFGQNWEGIFEGNRDPIRRGKLPVKSTQEKKKKKNWSIRTIIDFIKDKWEFLVAGSFLFSIIAIIQAGKAVVVDLPEIKEKIVNVSRISQSDEITIDIPVNDSLITKTIPVQRSIKDIRTIWVEEISKPEICEEINVEKRRIDEKKTELKFVIALENSQKNESTIKLKYLLVD